MANRPSKCRICGHRFASGEDICPECFTAREDDISCETMEKSEHTHGSDYSTVRPSDVFEEFKTESFVDEQREDEAKDPIPNATYGGKFGQAPQTYASSTYTNTQPQQPTGTHTGFTSAGSSFADRMQSAGSSRSEKLAALRNGTYIPQGGQFSGQNYYRAPGTNQTQTYGYGQRRSSSSKPFAIVIIVIFLLAFFIPVLTMVNTFNDMSKSSSNDSKADVRITDVSIDMPDVSIPNIDIPDITQVRWESTDYDLVAHDMTLGKEFTYGQALEWFTESDFPFFTAESEPADTDLFRLLEVPMGFDYKTDSDEKPYYFYFDMARLNTYNVKGELLSTGSCSPMMTDTENSVIAFIVPADTFTYELYIPVNSTSDENYEEEAEFSFFETSMLSDHEKYDRRETLHADE